jgi:hypothetical protein
MSYYMQPVSCQHREQHITKRSYKISVEQEIHISRLEYKYGSLNFLFTLFKVYIWDLVVEVWLIPFGIM